MIACTQMFTESSLQKKITMLCQPWHIGRKWAEGVFHHECKALQSCGGFTKLQFVNQSLGRVWVSAVRKVSSFINSYPTK
jgi:hypothetical protein